MDIYFCIFILFFLLFLLIRVNIHYKTKNNITLLHDEIQTYILEISNLKKLNHDYINIINNLKQINYKLKLDNHFNNLYKKIILPPG